MLYRSVTLFIVLVAGAAAFAPPTTRVASTLARTTTTSMQFGNALSGMNDELRKEMEGLEDDEPPMTKAGACSYHSEHCLHLAQ